MENQLIEKITKVLPLKALPTRNLVQQLRNSELNITLKTVLQITNVVNSGNEGGIVCVIEADNIEDLVCSITHLEIIKGQPLYDEIQKYQKKRIKKLQKQNQQY